MLFNYLSVLFLVGNGIFADVSSAVNGISSVVATLLRLDKRYTPDYAIEARYKNQRDERSKQQTAKHHYAHRLHQFATAPQAESQRYERKNGRQRRHEYWTKS